MIAIASKTRGRPQFAAHLCIKVIAIARNTDAGRQLT